MKSINVGIIGVSGYTGIELLRLLEVHPVFNLVQVTSRKLAKNTLKTVFPFINKYKDLVITDSEIDGFNSEVDLFFLAVPHGTAMDIAKKFVAQGKKVVDLSADFRLKDKETYEGWYNVEHRAWELVPQAVYGLPELYEQEIRSANLVANPGCYPTSVILALYPALKAGLWDGDKIVIDAKSGSTGAGRSPKENILFCEVNDNFFAYNVGQHRHTPEIEQELSFWAHKSVKVLFTTHLLPINRGILSTIYLGTKELDLDKIRAIYQDCYKDKRWVKVLDKSIFPQVRWVRGSMYCLLGLVLDKKTQQLVVVSAIDNLCRGASGQAICNANLLCGLDMHTGLEFEVPLVP
ncbi:MAG: N-acetyl-gamma-glutamyl-phosphate reductase [Desulfonauticus sp.]|nr:N-acetyl-gamma-glutamyl-phosphate reductase [Desulfonauticus sp.]